MESYWIWIILGLIVSAAEIFFGAFVLLVFGLSALLTGGVLALIGEQSLAMQLALYVGFLLIVGALVYRFARNMKAPQIGQAHQHHGEVGMMVKVMPPIDGQSSSRSGQVRFQKPILGADLWECQVSSAVEVGARVKIVGFQGSTVMVEAV